jgi:hypothetical protein
MYSARNLLALVVVGSFSVQAWAPIRQLHRRTSTSSAFSLSLFNAKEVNDNEYENVQYIKAELEKYLEIRRQTGAEAKNSE